MVWILAICLYKRAQRLESTIFESCKSSVVLRLRAEVGERIWVPFLADRTWRDLDVVATTVPMLSPAEIASRKLSLEVIAGEENGVVFGGIKSVVTGGSCRRHWHCHESECRRRLKELFAILETHESFIVLHLRHSWKDLSVVASQIVAVLYEHTLTWTTSTRTANPHSSASGR